MKHDWLMFGDLDKFERLNNYLENLLKNPSEILSVEKYGERTYLITIPPSINNSKERTGAVYIKKLENKVFFFGEDLDTRNNLLMHFYKKSKEKEGDAKPSEIMNDITINIKVHWPEWKKDLAKKYSKFNEFFDVIC